MPANRIKLEPALERRYAKRKERRKKRPATCKILIVCEGTKTEPNYFETFKTINRGTAIYDIDVKGLGQNTMDVVDKAIELKQKGDYDRVWAVFDKDSFPDNKFNGAIDKAMAHGIDCAWSYEHVRLNGKSHPICRSQKSGIQRPTLCLTQSLHHGLQTGKAVNRKRYCF